MRAEDKYTSIVIQEQESKKQESHSDTMLVYFEHRGGGIFLESSSWDLN
jgi:hypothetical protein